MPKRIMAGLLAVAAIATAVWAAPNIGQAAPNFRLTGIDGKTYELNSFKGKSDVIFLFWISKNCPISLAYDDYYNQLFEAFRGKNVTMIGINSNNNETMDEMKAHAQEHGFKFAIVRDPGARVADAYGAQRTPEVRVLNTNLILKYKGALTNNQNPARANVHHARNAVSALLAGRNPDPAEVDAFGCTIKR